MKSKKREWITSILLACLAALVAAININVFISTSGLVPGGFSGLSILLVRLAERYLSVNLQYSILYLFFNIPCFLLIMRYTSKKFLVVSLIDIILTSLLVTVIPVVTITDDILLAAVFGGIIGGTSSVLVLMAGGCGGGTDFIAIFFARKKKKSMWNHILVFNACLLTISGLFFGWESALYSIIFQYVATQVLDLFDKRYKRSCFIIITDKPQEIKDAVYNQLNHTVTEFTGIGGYSNETKNVLYTVVGKYEEKHLVDTIMAIDPHAFVNIMDSERVVGNFNEIDY